MSNKGGNCSFSAFLNAMTCNTLSKHLDRSSRTVTACLPFNAQDSFARDSHHTAFSEPRPASPQKIGTGIAHLPATNELSTSSAPNLQQGWENPNGHVHSSWLRQQFENVELALPRMHHHQANVNERLKRAIGQMPPGPWLPSSWPTAMNMGKDRIAFLTSFKLGLSSGSFI